MGLLDNNMIFTTPKTGLEGTAFRMVASTENYDVFSWEKTDSQTILQVTYKDVFAWNDAENVYIAKGKITDTPTTIAVNSTNFPNLRGTPSVVRIIACPCTFVSGSARYGSISSITAANIRLCIIFSNGQIYHNYPSCFDDHDFYSATYATWSPKVLVDDMFTKFAESAIWDLPNRKHPVKTTAGTDATLIATGAYYYNPALPESAYEIHPAINQTNGYGNSGFGATTNVNPISTGGDIGTRARFWYTDPDNVSANSFAFMGGYVADNLFTMIGTYRSNTTSAPCRICVFGTQDGGRNWFNMYEFAAMDKLHYGDQWSNPSSAVGLILAQSGSAGSGIYTIKQRTLVLPSINDKEPTNKFEYGSAINVTSISGDSNSIVFTTASAHGLVEKDCIIVDFQSGVSGSNRAFDWMVNSSTSSTSGGNGVMFKVHVLSTTTFSVGMYIWNTDNNLPCRHIHAINRCKDGVSVSTGENMPLGGWILYDSIISADAFGGYNVANLVTNNFIRLNSIKGCYHRSLGTIVQQEKEGTYCYISMDEAGIETADVSLPEGRTDVLKHNSTGIYKVKVEGIDSLAENGELLYQGRETAFGFQQMLNAFVYTGQYGDLAISFDQGKSWIECVMSPQNSGQALAHFSGPTYDRQFSINNILVQLKK